MNKSKIIVTDADGVLTDWEEGFEVWMAHRGHVPTVDDPKQYDNVGTRYEMDDEEIMRLVTQFNSSASIGFLPPQRDAQYYVKLLHEKHQFRFVVLTSAGDDPNVGKLRTRNLRKLMGENTFKDIICLPLGSSKRLALLELSAKYEGCYWIEDNIRNVDDGINAGFKGLLIEHKFNMHYKGPARIVKTWEEIYNLVTKNETCNL